MSDTEVMKKLLLVLNRIEKRLEELESKTEIADSKPVQAQSGKIRSKDPPLALKFGMTKYTETEDRISLDPVPDRSPEEIRLSGNRIYFNAKNHGERKRSDNSMRILSDGTPVRDLWTKYLGQAWRIPPDYRVSLSFAEESIDSDHERRLLENCKDSAHERTLLEKRQEEQLKQLQEFNTAIGPCCFDIVDFDDNDREIGYRLPRKSEKSLPLWNHPLEDQIFAESENSPFWGSEPFDFSDCHKMLEEKKRTSGSAFMRTAPWRRYICVRGLTSSNLKFEFDDIRYPYHGSPPEQRFPFSFPKALMKHHVEASFANPQIISWNENTLRDSTAYDMAFHMVVYMILEVADQDTQEDSYKNATYLDNETWRTGHLYDEETKIAQVSYSIHASMAVDRKMVIYRHQSPPTNEVNIPPHYIPFKEDVPLPKFWTILNFQPRFLPSRPLSSEFMDDIEDWNNFDTRHTADTMLRLIYNAILKAFASWDGLLSYFDDLLDDRKIFMKPKDHDNLLVDDEAFSRSRKYFWALSCLSEFEICIADNIHQWEASWRVWENEMRESDPENWENTLVVAQKIESVVEKLREYRKRFKTHHTNVTALRDGLFNASSVMESRAANQLGENVKLLTFVSIFFLPLAFTTSLWSMNTDLLSITTLSFVIPIIALSTYLIVFNLNFLVSLTRLTYTTQRSKLLSKMREDTNETWKTRGKKFDTFGFKPKSEVTKPSEWLISAYFLRMVPSFVVGGVRKMWPIWKRKKLEDVSASA